MLQLLGHWHDHWLGGRRWRWGGLVMVVVVMLFLLSSRVSFLLVFWCIFWVRVLAL